VWNGEGRQTNGQFKAGNRIAAGNPIARRQFELRTRLDELTTDDDDVEVWTTIKRLAKAGDPVGLKLFTEYRWGKPAQALEVISQDQDDPIADCGLTEENILHWALESLRGNPDERIKDWAIEYLRNHGELVEKEKRMVEREKRIKAAQSDGADRYPGVALEAAGERVE